MITDADREEISWGTAQRVEGRVIAGVDRSVSERVGFQNLAMGADLRL